MARNALTPVTLPADPANPLEAATKQYVDATALYVGTSAPASSLTELWYDTDEPVSPYGPFPPIFATTAARDAGIPSPVDGQRCITTDTDTEWSRVGGVWTVSRGQQVAYASKTADQASVTTLTDVTSLSLTFTAAGVGRRYKVHAHGIVTSTVVGDFIVLYFTDGADAQLGRAWQGYQVGTAGTGIGFDGSIFVGPSAGLYTVKLRIERNAGTGTVTFQASAAWPGSLSVEAV